MNNFLFLAKGIEKKGYYIEFEGYRDLKIYLGKYSDGQSVSPNKILERKERQALYSL